MHQLCFCSWLVLAAAGPFGHFEGCLYFFGLEFAQPTLLEHIIMVVVVWSGQVPRYFHELYLCC